MRDDGLDRELTPPAPPSPWSPGPPPKQSGDPKAADEALDACWDKIAGHDGLDRELASPAPPPPALPPRPPDEIGEDRWEWMAGILNDGLLAWAIVMVLSAIAFLFTIGSPPGPIVAFNYLMLVTSVAALTALVCGRWFGMKTFCCAAPVMILAALLIYAPRDSYEDKWTNTEDNTPWDEEDDAITRYSYRDTCSRWTGKMTHRRLSVRRYKNGEGTSWTVVSGPMSDSGKCHGKWKTLFLRPLDFGNPAKTEWYWYGEKISEGEWHLRNK